MAQNNANEIASQVDEIPEASFGFNLTYLFTVIFSFPLFAFIFCLSLTFILHYEESTDTHCHVSNYLPSISSAIGLQPQKYIWQFFIALQVSPRLFGGLIYHKFYLSFPSTTPILLHVLMFADVGENLALLFLTVVSSKEAHSYHVAGFVLFVVLSQLHMMLKLFLNVMIWNDPMFSLSQRKSFKIKKKLWLVNLFSVLLACIFFYVHNTSCEAGAYTLFAACEYIIVLSNMAYHACSYYEFHSSSINIEVGTYYKMKTKPV